MIQVEHLTKQYGTFTAVHDLSFAVEEGGIYGFLGPNGAGKSTTMNIMTGCLSATEGTVRIGGYDIFEEAQLAKRLIGYLPEQPPLYLHETAEEYLRFVGEAKGLKGESLENGVQEVIERTRISGVRNKLIGLLSKGYRQRVGIAQALLGNPRLIILDEPTVGLDPIQIIEIRELIRQLGADHTVLLSSHILPEVQALCSKILIMAKGELVAFDTPENLEQQMLASDEIDFTAEAAVDEVLEILSTLPEIGYQEIDGDQEGVTRGRLRANGVDVTELSRNLFFAFAAKKRALLEMRLHRVDLEDIFIELTENAEAPLVTDDLETVLVQQKGDEVNDCSMQA